MIEYTNYNEGFENLLDDEPVYFSAYDQRWDNQTIQELWDKYHVFYNGGIHAYLILPRKTSDPLIITGYEDDGRIQFPRNYRHFEHPYSSYWLKSLITDLTDIRNLVNNGEV